MNTTKLAAVAAALTLVGCASAPPPKSDAEIRNAYYGAFPGMNQCKKLAMQAVGAVLKDPYSAQYRFEPSCPKNYLNQYGTYYFGHHIGGTVNSKNGYGGYVGETRFDVIIQDGVVIARCIEATGVTTGCTADYEWTTDKRYSK